MDRVLEHKSSRGFYIECGRNARPHPNPLPLGRGRAFGCVVAVREHRGGREVVRVNGARTVRPRVTREYFGDDRSGVSGSETCQSLHCRKPAFLPGGSLRRILTAGIRRAAWIAATARLT